MAGSIPVAERRGFLKVLTKVLGAGALGGFAPVLLAEERNLIQNLHLDRKGDSLKLVFDLTSDAEHKLFHLPNPDRVVLDLKHTSLAKGVNLAVDKNPPISKLRYAYRNTTDMRVVFDVDHPLEARSFFRKSEQSHQLVIELNQRGSGPLVAPVKSIEDVAPKLRDLVIAIDAGHGGKDPGAVGKRGTYEKDVVLQVARRLEKHLKKHKGYKPVLIRTGDTFLPLRDRIRKARAQQADLFISIHADASPNRKAKGSSVFVLSENGASSEAARLLAEHENAVDLIGGVRLKDKDDDLAEVLLDLSQRYTIEASHTVATDMLTELRKVGQIHSPRVEQAGFVVLKSPDVPSVLVETAFISNPTEEKRLRTAQHQEKIAKSLVSGIKRYFRNHAPEGTVVSSLRREQHIIRSGETLSGIASRYDVELKELRRHNSLESDVLRVGQVLKIPAG